jgi:hypothetical protein
MDSNLIEQKIMPQTHRTHTNWVFQPIGVFLVIFYQNSKIGEL